MGVIGIQFHPEVVHTPLASEIIGNFLYQVCGCRADLDARQLHRASRRRHPRARSATGRVICALSGGVDSAVAAALIHRAIGDQLTCVFVDNGLLRRERARADVDDVRAST